MFLKPGFYEAKLGHMQAIGCWIASTSMELDIDSNLS
jgi:hypothetical protein